MGKIKTYTNQIRKSNYELRTSGIESGSASIRVDLEHGKIIVKHGTHDVILKEIDNVEEGSWDKIWDAINSIKSVD
tara:strand:+ start:1914 stop:2141 length:228 start_codon:yes stop_codon:yes gene_type:complete